jgi:hypothetical protein
MADRFRPDPNAFDGCVRQLCRKIEAVALRSGMSDPDCGDLEGTLAAMPETVRDRTRLMLNGIDIRAEYDDPTMAFAARYILSLAKDIWQVNPHPLTHSQIRSPFVSKRS